MSAKKWYTNINWMFLLFLAGATYVKLYIKVAAIIAYAAYCIYQQYEFKKVKRIHAFYILMPVIGLVAAFSQQAFQNDNYFFAFSFSSIYWVVAGAISYLLYIAVINQKSIVIHNTFKGFIALNAIVSLGELGKMIIDSGELMPYWHWGPNMYYGGATGDHILGLTNNISVTNAMICALAGLYFIFHKELKWALLCVVISILCTSNLTLIFLLVILALVILIIKDTTIRKYAVYSFVLSSALYPILTYDNIEYFGTVYEEDIKYKAYTEVELEKIQKISSREWTEDEKTPKKPFKRKNNNYYKLLLKDSFAMAYISDLQYINYYKEIQPDKNSGIVPLGNIHNLMKDCYGIEHGEMPLSTYHYPIKIYTHLQVLDYLRRNNNFLLGAGPANFSSKTAIKATGLGFQGSYKRNKIYASVPFLEYHLYSLLYVLGLPASEHSILNMPNSSYNHLAGEYGFAGVLAFLFLYLGYCFVYRKQLGKGVYLVLMMLMCFDFEYWFEMISLTVIFELLLFTYIHKPKPDAQ